MRSLPAQRDSHDPQDVAAGADDVGPHDMTANTLADRRSTMLWWLLQMVFLPFGIPLLTELAHAHPTPARLIVSLVGAALFVALYACTTFQNARELANAIPHEALSEFTLWWPIGALGIGAWLLTGLNGPVWGSLFIFTAAAACARLPLRQAFVAVGAVALAILIGGVHEGMAPGDLLEALVTLGVTGSATCSVVQAVRTAQVWRAQREELARHAAVAEERLRIARDLHDLLGHNLSVIALKSELARRLMSVAPERAEAEIADVEHVARQALQEVREAVAGYRQPTLAGELAAARELLGAAGIRYRFAGDERAILGIPAAVNSALGWAVREGVTNILRHSSASSCMLCFTRDEREVTLELVNDGVRGSEQPSDITSLSTTSLSMPAGNGLRGLRERARSLGGTLEARTPTPGSFCLSVTIPLVHATLAEEPLAEEPRVAPPSDAGGGPDVEESMHLHVEEQL
ncbi:MAG TPA: sensor histidine kinase [Ktedonobacterales bacterium]